MTYKWERIRRNKEICDIFVLIVVNLKLIICMDPNCQQPVFNIMKECISQKQQCGTFHLFLIVFIYTNKLFLALFSSSTSLEKIK